MDGVGSFRDRRKGRKRTSNERTWSDVYYKHQKTREVVKNVCVISSDDDEDDNMEDKGNKDNVCVISSYSDDEDDDMEDKGNEDNVCVISSYSDDEDDDMEDKGNEDNVSVISSYSDDEDDDMEDKGNQENDPVLERPVKGYTAERLLDIIVGKQVRTANICQSVPRSVRKHAAYVVDTVALGCSDIISFGDDNGSWNGHSKPRRKYKIELSEQIGITSLKEYHPTDKGLTDPTDVYTLCRNYFRHAHTPEFRKVIATVFDSNGAMLPLAVVQYFFEGGIEVPIKLPKHGNAKKQDAEPYMRTSRPVLKKLQDKCRTKPCKFAVDECYEEGGGSFGCRSIADVPRNRKQAYNLNMQRREGQTAKRHEFYDVLELLNKGTFVKDFGFAKSSASQRTQPRSFQATDFQLSDLSRVCQSRRFSSVLGVDATFNCGPFYVTLTSYQHKMFINQASGKYPVIVGPSIIHMTKEFEDYHYLTTQLKVHCKGFDYLQAYGTDGEVNLINAFVCELPQATHLRCKIHLADNIERKLTSLSFGKSGRQRIINSIFGKRYGVTREKGLADANSPDEFDQMLEDAKPEWYEVESAEHSGEPKFHSWFKRHLGEVMKENVIAPVREIAGLGSLPEFYTQNVSECCNSVVKGDAGNQMQWSDFCISIQGTAERQERELKRAIHQMGEYRLAPEFKHLEVKSNKWLHMTTPQKDAHFKWCFSNPLDKLGHSDEVEAVSVSGESEGKLSVPYEESGITTISKSNLRQMWCSATEILHQDQGVMTLPWDTTASQKIVFDGECKPPCHVQVSGHKVKCGCPKYNSTMICSHSLAVAEHDLILPQFLSSVRKSKKLPDPYVLVRDNLPKSAGKKSATRRKGNTNVTQPPLMTIQSSTGSASKSSDDLQSFEAATALVALSNRQSNDYCFRLKELKGTQVRVCYGCGKVIRVPPQVPPPPHDVCIVNQEFRTYRKADGSLHVSNDRQNCHYHLFRVCVERKHRDFSPSMLKVPQDLKLKLTAVHWDWLDKEFEMFL